MRANALPTTPSSVPTHSHSKLPNASDPSLAIRVVPERSNASGSRSMAQMLLLIRDVFSAVLSMPNVRLIMCRSVLVRRARLRRRLGERRKHRHRRTPRARPRRIRITWLTVKRQDRHTRDPQPQGLDISEALLHTCPRAQHRVDRQQTTAGIVHLRSKTLLPVVGVAGSLDLRLGVVAPTLTPT